MLLSPYNGGYVIYYIKLSPGTNEPTVSAYMFEPLSNLYPHAMIAFSTTNYWVIGRAYSFSDITYYQNTGFVMSNAARFHCCR